MFIMDFIRLAASLLFLFPNNILCHRELDYEFYISTGREIISILESSDHSLITRTLLDSGLEDAEVLDVDYRDRKVYWADMELRTINRVATNTTSNVFETLIENDIQIPGCIAVDWVAGNIFFSDLEKRRIEVASANGLYRKVLVYQNLTAPIAIAIDVYTGYMFWIDNSSHPVIERAAFDGTGRETVISEDLVNPHGLTIDYNNDVPLLFWINTVNGHGVIQYSFLNGTGRSTLTEDLNGIPKSLSVSGNEIFWAGADSTNHSIFQYSKATRSISTFYQTNKNVCDLSTPQALNHTVASPCKTKGICSYLCLTLPPGNTYKCACPTGLNLRNDNRSCQIYPNQVLMTSHDDGVRYVSLDVPNEFIDVSLPIASKHTKNSDYVQFGVGHMVYWCETADNLTQTSYSAIRRASLNGSIVDTLVNSGLHTPSGLAIDNSAGNLYWIDRHLKRIEISRLNGSSRKLLINSNLNDPHSLAIDDSGRSLMYWIDQSSETGLSYIERSYLDGTNRRVIVNLALGLAPLAITVDRATGYLYWVDSGGTIERCDSDGNNRNVVHTSNSPWSVINGITIVDSNLYWVDKLNGSLWRANKVNGREAVEILTGLKHVRGMSSADTLHTTDGGSCQYYRLCSHLCLSNPGLPNPTCSCPDGLTLDADGNRCLESPSQMILSKSTGITLVNLVKSSCQSNTNSDLGIKTSDSMIAIDVEVSANRTYWIDKIRKTIYRASNSDGVIEAIVTGGLAAPADLAVDWMGGNLYWCDRLSGKVEVSKLDGSNRRVLLNGLNYPKLLEVNPVLGVLYVVTDVATIEVYRMDGQGGVVRTYTDDRGFSMTSLAVEHGSNQLYFKADYEEDDPRYLSRVTHNLTDAHTVLDFFNFKYPRPTSPFAIHDFIYLVLGNNGISTFFKTGSIGCFEVQSIGRVLAAKVLHYDRQPGFHWCQVDNGGCAGLCLPQRYGRLCQCPAHQIYDSNLNICKDVDDFIVFSNSSGIYHLPMTEGSTHNLLPLGTGEIAGVEYNSYTDQLYWVETRELFDTGSVKRGNFNGSGQETIKDVSLINTNWLSLQLDHVGGHAFWTLHRGNQIVYTKTSSNISGNASAVLLQRTELNPRALAFNAEESIVYFVNWYGTGSVPFSTIQQLHLSDPSVSELVYEGSNREKQDSLFYDSDTQQLYWSDSKRDAILRCNIPCEQPITVLSIEFENNLVFHIDGGYIYWYDSAQQAIFRADKYNGTNPTVYATGVVHLNDFVIGHRPKTLRTTLCTREFSVCSHLCIPGQITQQCSCPYHWKKSNGSSHLCEFLGCGEYESACADKSACIPQESECDGTSDCVDGSDELIGLCPCRHNQFTCSNGMCVPMELRCDKEVNCLDNSDEKLCDCPSGFTSCHLNRGFLNGCIPDSWICDGDTDCESSIDDEANCSNISSTPSTSPPTTQPVSPTTQTSYPAGHTVIIAVCSVMGGLIVFFLGFLIVSLCYFAGGKTVRHYKFPNSPDNSSRLSTESALTPSSEISLPTKSTNLPSIDGVSYDSHFRRSGSQSSIITATTQEPLHPPPPTPTSRSKSVHFLTGGYGSAIYFPKSTSPYDYEDDYMPPCPSAIVGFDDTDDHISSVSERAERDYRLMNHHAQYYREHDCNSITTVETRHTYNTESCFDPPPPSLASFSHDDGESYYDDK